MGKCRCRHRKSESGRVYATSRKHRTKERAGDGAGVRGRSEVFRQGRLETEQQFEDALRFFDQDGRRRTRSSRTLCDSSTRTVGDGAGVRGRSEVLRQGRSRTHQCAAAQVSATVVRGTARKRGPQRADENGRCQGRRKDRLSWY